MGPKEGLKEETVLLTPDTEPIPQETVIKDLGVLVDERGDFSDQRAEVIRKVKAKRHKRHP